MPTLRREDGAQFVVQSYRELLSSKKIGALKREIRALAKNHGDYVRCFRQESGQMEAVFSREPGYLLGEAVWNYFGRPRDLIYCEALPDRQHALLVIIKDGSVYLDTKAVFSDLIDEFVALATNSERFLVYTYGNVPLSDTPGEGRFVFNESRVQQFKSLTDPVFPKLALNSQFQLQPLELALTAPELSRPVFIPLAIICILVFAGISLWHWHEVKKQTQEVVATVFTSPYVSYNNALMTPAPQEQLSELIKNIVIFFTMPGWQVEEVAYQDKEYTIKVKATIGEVKQLQLWAKTHNFNNLQIGANEATFHVLSHLVDRPQPKYVYNLQKTIAKLASRLITVVPKENITVAAPVNLAPIQYVSVTINFSDLSPAILTLFGKILQLFPVQISTITIDTKSGLLSGNMQFTVWGN